MNSVSTVINASVCIRWQKVSSSGVVAMRVRDGNAGREGRAMGRFYTAACERPKPRPRTVAIPPYRGYRFDMSSDARIANLIVDASAPGPARLFGLLLLRLTRP